MSTELTTTAGDAAHVIAGRTHPLRFSLRRGRTAWRRIRQSGILLALVVLLLVGWLTSDHFLQVDNLLNVSRQMAIVGILGIGMTFVILTAGIDLSIGSIVGVSAIATASSITKGVPWPVSLLIGLAAGAVAGAINGLGVTKGKLQPFIMTLCMLVIARGATMTYADGKPIALGDRRHSLDWLGTGEFIGLPVPVWILAAMATTAAVVLRYTQFGRHVYAVGDNREAARLSGIDIDRVTFAVYVISGLCAAVTALIIVARLTAGEPSQGTGFELDAIAIVVIGGTSLFGGEGGIGGTLVGAAIVAVIANLLNLLGVSPFSQQIVKGLIILGAVLFERQTAGRREGR